jgi:hypothetical protein
MHSLLKSLLVVSVVCSTLAVAQPQGEVVIRSRDGKTRMGRILSETSKGYLLSGPDGTEVVEFSSIVDIRQVAATGVQASAPVAPVAPVAPPMVAAPAPVAKPSKQPVVAAPPPMPAPVAVAAVEAPPAPPERPLEPSITELSSSDVPEVKSAREGFHFGLGAGAFILPTGPLVQAQAHFEFNFGKPVYRIDANLGVLGVYTSTFVNVSVDNLFQFNVGDVYAFGAGLQVGLMLGPAGFLQLSPMIQPVILKFGERGQHQVSLTGAITVLSTVSVGYYGAYTFAGTPQVYLGYSYLF